MKIPKAIIVLIALIAPIVGAACVLWYAGWRCDGLNLRLTLKAIPWFGFTLVLLWSYVTMQMFFQLKDPDDTIGRPVEIVYIHAFCIGAILICWMVFVSDAPWPMCDYWQQNHFELIGAPFLLGTQGFWMASLILMEILARSRK